MSDASVSTTPADDAGAVPRVCVAMAAYNRASLIEASIDSILTQTMREFEFIIADDCSTDDTLDVVKRRASEDPRIVVLENPTNVGQSATLNHIAAVARAPYIAIMDSDDIAAPERLRLQVEYLDAHPEVGVVGSLYSAFTDDITAAWPTTARTDGTWRDGSIVMGHPTMTIRRDAFERIGGYDPRYTHANDYDLQAKLGHAGVKMHVLDEDLLWYRVHDDSITGEQRREQITASLRVSWRILLRYRTPLTRRGFAEFLRYHAIYAYLVLRLDRVISKDAAKRIWPARS